ncbi:MAG: serine/threonine protein kinase [Myxococcales bacterium]|nr:serine/threonine protein kinase [Myxococcales bacterium]
MSEQRSTLADHPLAKKFQCLGPHQVISAVESAGFACTGRLLALNSYENRVYQVDVEDGPAVIAKFYRPGRWSVDTIEDEHDFLFELADDGISVSKPLVLDGGYSLETLDGEAAGINYALFEKVAGRLDDEPNSQKLVELGRSIAAIHTVGARRDADHRQTLSVEAWGQPALEAIVASGLLPLPMDAAYSDIAQTIFEYVAAGLDGVPTHRIHGDCHHSNLVWDDKTPVYFDFDDMVHGPAVQDIWMLAPSSDATGRLRRSKILDGYRDVLDFSDYWLQLVEPLRALRIIRYSGWIAMRWHDPTFQNTFAHVLNDAFWADEIRQLRDIVYRIQHPEEPEC